MLVFIYRSDTYIIHDICIVYIYRLCLIYELYAMVDCSFLWQRLNQLMPLRHRLNRSTSKGMAQRFCWIFGRHHAGSLCVSHTHTHEPWVRVIEMKHLEEGHEMMRSSSCTGAVRWRTAKNCIKRPFPKFQDDCVKVLFCSGLKFFISK